MRSVFRRAAILAFSFVCVHAFTSQNVRNDVDSRARCVYSEDTKCLTGDIQQESKGLQSRDGFLRTIQNGCLALTVGTIGSTPALGFDGGVGGLGKTKPETGVEFFDESSAPIQSDQGLVAAEIRGKDGSPILVSFESPWPLLPTSGTLETRDIRSVESAFVQVLSCDGKKWKEKKQFQALLMDSVFGAQGKFGAYGQPFDVQVKAIPSPDSSDSDYSKASLFAVTFTTLTPAMRESERKASIAAKQVGNTLVMLVTTTTSARYASNQKTFQKISSSFEAIAAPQSSLKKGSSSSK